MRKSFNKMIAVMLCVCFVFTFCLNNVLAADENITNNGGNYKVIQNDDKICTVMSEVGGSAAYATLNKTTNEITVQTVEKAKNKIFGQQLGQEKKALFSLKVESAVNGELSATLIDKETKKELKIHRSKKNDKVTAQLPFVIAGGIALGGLIDALLAAAAIIVVSGVTYYAATKAIEKVRNQSYSYYAAYVVPGDDVYIAEPVNSASAIARLQGGLDVFAKTSTLAYAAAKSAAYGLTPVGAEIHSGNPGKQYWHYHPYNRIYESHSLFATWG